VIVKTMTASAARANYKTMLDDVVDNCEEVIITRANREPVVVVALSEWESLKETDYLLRSPANARRLMRSIEQLESGGGVVKDLAE
jgi:antitoxin YefM